MKQTIFRKNWNIIAEILEKSNVPNLKKLPRLGNRGNCGGLSTQLNYMLRLFPEKPELQEKQFFDLYKFLCENDPQKVAAWILDKSDQLPDKAKFIDDLINFVINIYIFQNKIGTHPVPKITKDKSSFGRFFQAPMTHEELIEMRRFNSYRMGCDDHVVSLKPKKSSELCAELKKIPLEPGQACQVIMDLDNNAWHAMLIYKIGDEWRVFDCNDNQNIPYHCKNPEEAAQYITKRTNSYFVAYNQELWLISSFLYELCKLIEKFLSGNEVSNTHDSQTHQALNNTELDIHFYNPSIQFQLVTSKDAPCVAPRKITDRKKFEEYTQAPLAEPRI